MHISDGILPVPLLIAGGLSTSALTAFASRSLRDEDIPRTAVMTATFFMASLVAIPLPFSSVHLVLVGLAGVVLGRVAFLAILVGATLQALLFQHGGLAALGVNATNLGVGSLVAAGVFAGRRADAEVPQLARRAAIAAGLGTLTSVGLYALSLAMAGAELSGYALWALLANLCLVPLEALLTLAAIRFIARVEPGALIRPRSGGTES